MHFKYWKCRLQGFLRKNCDCTTESHLQSSDHSAPAAFESIRAREHTQASSYIYVSAENNQNFCRVSLSKFHKFD